MSFFKFWGKKGKSKDDLDLKKEETEAEADKRKLRHSLSISRSGRFKQKNRERSGILDRPELYGTEQQDRDDKEPAGFSETSSSASTASNSSAMSSSHTVTAPSRAPPAGYRQQHQDTRHIGHSMPT